MKLVRASQGPANRAEAWACLMANLALPGSGSLAAGKTVGYYQLALGGIGLILSVATGIHLLEWMAGSWPGVNQPSADPLETLSTLWREIRWPLAGLCIFAISLLWSVVTGLQILSAHPKTPPPPPRIVN